MKTSKGDVAGSFTDYVPFTPPQLIGITPLDTFEREEALMGLLHMHQSVTRSLFERRGGIHEMQFYLYCQCDPLTGGLPEALIPAEVLRQAKEAVLELGSKPDFGLIYQIQMKPGRPCDSENKELLSRAVAALCTSGRAIGVAWFSEVWLNMAPTGEEWPKGTLEGKPGTTEHVMVMLETKAHSYMSTAPITEEKGSRKLGAFALFEHEGFEGRFVDLLVDNAGAAKN